MHKPSSWMISFSLSSRGQNSGSGVHMRQARRRFLFLRQIPLSSFFGLSFSVSLFFPVCVPVGKRKKDGVKLTGEINARARERFLRTFHTFHGPQVEVFFLRGTLMGEGR